VYGRDLRKVSARRAIMGEAPNRIRPESISSDREQATGADPMAALALPAKGDKAGRSAAARRFSSHSINPASFHSIGGVTSCISLSHFDPWRTWPAPSASGAHRHEDGDFASRIIAIGDYLGGGPYHSCRERASRTSGTWWRSRSSSGRRVAKEFDTIAVYDGIAMAPTACSIARPSRVSSLQLEYMANAHCAERWCHRVLRHITPCS